MEEKIVVGHVPTQPITDDKDIVNLVKKAPEKKSFSMTGVVTDEFASDLDAPSEQQPPPPQEKSTLVENAEKKPVEKVAKKEEAVVEKTEEKPVVEKTTKKKITTKEINAARELLGEKPIEVIETPETPSDKNTTEKTVEKPVEIPKDFTEKLTTVEKERDALKQLIEKPLVKKVLEIAGDGDIRKFVSQFDLTDYDAMSDDDIHKISLQNKGLTEEEVQEAVEDFSDLSSYKKKLQVKDIREQLKAAADEKNQTFLSAPSVNPEQMKYRQEQERVAITSLDERLKTIADKGYYGIFVPDNDDINEVRNYALSNPVVVTKDGRQSYDMGKSVENALWSVPSLRSKFLSAFGEIKKHEGYEEKIKERTRVSPNDFVPGSQSLQKTSFSDVMKGQKIVTPVNN